MPLFGIPNEYNMYWRNAFENRVLQKMDRHVEFCFPCGYRKDTHKKKVYIDFWIFLVYNSTMIFQVIVTFDRQAEGPIISRGKLR
jgi:hypothetical protein